MKYKGTQIEIKMNDWVTPAIPNIGCGHKLGREYKVVKLHVNSDGTAEGIGTDICDSFHLNQLFKFVKRGRGKRIVFKGLTNTEDFLI